jgi:hypothetical protein
MITGGLNLMRISLLQNFLLQFFKSFQIHMLLMRFFANFISLQQFFCQKNAVAKSQ